MAADRGDNRDRCQNDEIADANDESSGHRKEGQHETHCSIIKTIIKNDVNPCLCYKQRYTRSQNNTFNPALERLKKERSGTSQQDWPNKKDPDHDRKLLIIGIDNPVPYIIRRISERADEQEYLVDPR